MIWRALSFGDQMTKLIDEINTSETTFSFWDIVCGVIVLVAMIYVGLELVAQQQQAIAEVVADFCLNATNYTDCLSDPYKYGMEPINAI